MPSLPFSQFPDHLVYGIQPGRFYLQPGEIWTSTEKGPDVGRVQWLTSPDTPESQYPQKGAKSSRYPRMLVCEVTPSNDESGLILISAQYRGSKTRTGAGPFKVHTVNNSASSVYNLPTLTTAGGTKTRSVAKVPHPQFTRDFLTTTAPNYNDVGNAVSAPFLPDHGNFNLAFTADPDEPPTHNLVIGWKLDSRTWEDCGDAGVLWHVTEVYVYEWAIAA